MNQYPVHDDIDVMKGVNYFFSYKFAHTHNWDVCVVVYMEATSIRIHATTRERLLCLKRNPRESFDSVISRLLDQLVDAEPLSDEMVQTIETSMKEYREGVCYTHEEILAEMNLVVDPDTLEIVDLSAASETSPAR